MFPARPGRAAGRQPESRAEGGEEGAELRGEAAAAAAGSACRGRCRSSSASGPAAPPCSPRCAQVTAEKEARSGAARSSLPGRDAAGRPSLPGPRALRVPRAALPLTAEPAPATGTHACLLFLLILPFLRYRYPPSMDCGQVLSDSLGFLPLYFHFLSESIFIFNK